MINRILNDYQRLRQNEQDDSIFYSQPRFVYHLDSNFRKRLERYYRNNIIPESIILDFMSSWVSHLPSDIKYKKVIGHGLNKDELIRNKLLDEYWVQDVNQVRYLPIDDESFDYILVCAGWQYLIHPEDISSELFRILKKGGRVIISFSNRAFWEKTPNIWLHGNENKRIKYIENIFIQQGFSNVTHVLEYYQRNFLPIFSQSTDPFVCVDIIK